MKKDGVSLSIVVGGRAAREFISPINQNTYIEGRKGASFGIRVQNHNPFRVEVVITVDGLSINTGKPGSSETRGYVLGAGAVTTIPGWSLGDKEAASFFFSDTRKSGDTGQGEAYVEQMGEAAENIGVFGMAVFREDRVEHILRSRPDISKYDDLIRPISRGGRRTPGGFSTTLSTSRSGGGEQMKCASRGLSTSSASASLANTTIGSGTPSLYADGVALSASAQQTVGTGFGEAVDYRTHSTSFKRGASLSDFAIFYLEERELKKVGIDVRKPVATLPNPFPADAPKGCATPPGWQR